MPPVYRAEGGYGRCTPPTAYTCQYGQLRTLTNLLQSEIQELRVLMQEWDRLSVNRSGASQYKGIARRVVLQAQKIEELINANVFTR